MAFEEQKSIINFPDLLFAKYCNEIYGLNRGVYNTIDEWFYKNNIESIEMRRKNILDFLQWTRSFHDKETYKLKFGKGNLITLLTEYRNLQEVFI